ncbi:MAG: hypothetical protein Q4F72_12355, partial [Desulfovibrionaceae bacterium]|nr:hypothetical protein [Desulfovibrionaceae bacterium]
MALADLLHPLAALCRARLHPSDRARTNQARRSDEIRRSDEALQAGQPLQADETGHSVLSFQSDEPRQAALAMPEIDIEGMPAMPDSLTAAASGHIPDSPADRSSIASHASTGASAAGQSDGLASGQTAGQAAGTAAGAAAEPTGRTLAQAAPSGTPAPRLAVPAAIAARVRLEGSVLHCSAELRGSPELDLMLAKAERQGMVLSCAWHVPAAFEQRFGLHAVLQDGIEVTGCAGRDAQTWVEEATRALVARAVEKKATDIHITCMGPYASIRFRRMGLMVDEGAMDGETGARLVRGIFQGQLSQAEAG